MSKRVDNKTMKVLMVSSEAVPFSKSGGLADVVSALSFSLSSLGHEVKVFMPFYSFIEKDGFKKVISFQIPMLGKNEKAEVWEKNLNGVVFSALKHPYFSERKGIYGDTSFSPYSDNCARFISFSKAVALFLRVSGFSPDIVHAHDWPCGFVFHFLKYFKIETKTLFTIHNLEYQGVFSPLDAVITSSVIDKNAIRNGQINMMAEAILTSDKITTVSPSYAKEILTPRYGAGLEDILKIRENDIYGILNGIDTNEWNPQKDELIKYNYSYNDLSAKRKDKEKIQKEFKLEENPNIPLIAIISRLANQKGFDSLLLEGEESVLEKILKKRECQVALIGTGDNRYISVLSELMTKYDNLSIKIVFSQALSHELEAGADFFLMPSRYEPCGLNQMYSLHYGTLAIVHSTGGLKDTVIDMDNENGTGFVFHSLIPDEIEKAVERAIEFYKDKKKLEEAQIRAMKTDFSWKKSAKKYEKLYMQLIKQNL